MDETSVKENNSVKKHDWGLFGVGLVVLAIGLIVLFWPAPAWLTLVIIAGVLLLIVAVFQVVVFVRYRSKIQGSAWIIVNAILDVIVGLMFLIHPVIAADVIPWVVGTFLIIYGVIAIIGGIFMRDAGSFRWTMVTNGIVGIVCGILFVTFPVLFVIFLGIFIAARGVMMIVSGIAPPANLPQS